MLKVCSIGWRSNYAQIILKIMSDCSWNYATMPATLPELKADVRNRRRAVQVHRLASDR